MPAPGDGLEPQSAWAGKVSAADVVSESASEQPCFPQLSQRTRCLCLPVRVGTRVVGWSSSSGVHRGGRYSVRPLSKKI